MPLLLPIAAALLLPLVGPGAAPTNDPAPDPAPAGQDAPTSMAEFERRVDAIAARVEAADDDEWPAERRGDTAGRRLSELAARLTRPGATARRFDSLLARGARATALAPAPDARVARIESANLHGWSWDAPPEAAPDRAARDALAGLAAGWRGEDRHVAFKVVTVEESSAGRAGFETTVRVELDDAGPAGVAEERATWRVLWFEPDDGPALIARIVVTEWQRTEAPRPWFVDVAGAVIDGDIDLIRRLGQGAETWYGRLDTVGEPFLMGHHGIALGDVDGDGSEDLYVANATGLPNALLVRRPDGTLHDVAEAAGVAWLDDTKGVLLVDIDNDGDDDLVAAIGPTIVIARNDGTGRFGRLVHLRAPTPAAFYSVSAADFDLDGDLDLYGTRYVRLAYGVSVPLPFHDAENGPTNHLLRNDGDGRFVDVTAAVGLDAANTRFSLVGAWGDYDGDGDPDLYVANDFGRNVLYRNDGGRFTDVSRAAGVEDQAAGMGAAFADYDGDGDLDLHVTNMWSSAGRRVAWQPAFQPGLAPAGLDGVRRHALGDSLFRNAGDGTFEDVADAAGVRVGRWGWGGRFADLDNDGAEDLVVPNGFVTGAREHDL